MLLVTELRIEPGISNVLISELLSVATEHCMHLIVLFSSSELQYSENTTIDSNLSSCPL